jgi:hypothetical protein
MELVFSKKCIDFEGNGDTKNARGAYPGLAGHCPF